MGSPRGLLFLALLGYAHAAAIQISPVGGSYVNSVSVTLTSSDPLYWTTDGTTPTENSNNYYGPVVIDSKGETTLKVAAFTYNSQGSLVKAGSVEEAKYHIRYVAPDAPTISPKSGHFDNSVSVTITCTGSSSVYYTTDGSTPIYGQSMTYYGPVTLSNSGLNTLKAICAVEANLASPVATEKYTIKVIPPAPVVYTPSSGTFANTVTITMTCATAGTNIYYTSDGSTPVLYGSTYYYQPVVVNFAGAYKFRAIAFNQNDNNLGSVESNATFTVTSTLPPPAAPVLVPSAGTFQNQVQVTISPAAGNSATVYYTTDGSKPTRNSQQVYSAVTLSATTTIRAIAANNLGGNYGPVVTGVYKVDQVTPAVPTLTPHGGSFTNEVAITITSATEGAQIYYTTDGTKPTTTSTNYYGPVDITNSGSTTVRAIAVNANHNALASAVAGGRYTIHQKAPAAPTMLPAGGKYANFVSVTITSTTTGSQIYYTTDGTTPTTMSQTYYSPVLQTSGSFTIKAIAVDPNNNNFVSAATSAAYTIYSTPLTGLSKAAATDYHVVGNKVYYYVYRVHGELKALEGDNAASPGGEIGFLANEFQYDNGVILRDCVEMTNEEFSTYDCCNDGSCSQCGYSGSGSSTNPNMPGRSFQLYPPPGAPCAQQSGATCTGKPAAGCNGDCSGWWYSFQAQGKCSDSQQIGDGGCTWKVAPVTTTILYQDVLAAGGTTCELSSNSPAGGCSGNMAWKPFTDNVELLLKQFNTKPETWVRYGDTFVQSAASAFPDPAHGCKAPCAPGSYSGSGYLDTSNNCTLCAAGTYAATAASTSCAVCATANTVGATSCGGSASVLSDDVSYTVDQSTSSSGTNNAGVVAGAVTACAALVGAVVASVVLVQRRRRRLAALGQVEMPHFQGQYFRMPA